MPNNIPDIRNAVSGTVKKLNCNINPVNREARAKREVLDPAMIRRSPPVRVKGDASLSIANPSLGIANPSLSIANPSLSIANPSLRRLTLKPIINLRLVQVLVVRALVHLRIVLIRILCEYMSNDLPLVNINFTLRPCGGHMHTSTKGKERAHPEPQNTPPTEHHGSNL